MGLTLQGKTVFSLAMVVSLLMHGFALVYIYLDNFAYKRPVGNPALRVKLVQKKLPVKTDSMPEKKTVKSKQKTGLKQQPKTPVKPETTITRKSVEKAILKPVQTAALTKPEAVNEEVEEKAALQPLQQTTPSDLAQFNVPTETPAQNKSAVTAYANNPKPVYPIAAKRRGMTGIVLLEVTVSVTGDASRIRIKKSSGYVILDKAASKAVATWKFIPASENGEDIESLVEIPIRFELTQNS